ncbi:Ras-related protein R-Ras2, putative [Trichomonas vaginalis G3]|uniref:Ras-related protein R-Ras2, putative n=1 Tax=Trichomonas vaginalis (strain ATCC PRA-98 / G3) TaxID=412133 RepID=A2ES53_TRIV3|nr:GTPase protein [Trichomonas vaginalis G3]EAY04490.1 Ras-related protein R-Ras2, putative [Trichomonas vaginalis G3]KAI5503285.1 GTPase protein [Trichomonas vaginalis G3]|eukprot:XP_001316713.1 Ras-related protein R-Ras2 [Trichomonas vaginalis G3]
MIGNKADLAANRQVTLAEAEAFAEHQQLSYLEASAKGGDNVKEAFVRTAAQILNRGIKVGPKSDVKPVAKSSDKKGCC